MQYTRIQEDAYLQKHQGSLCLDISDLLHFLRHSPNVTGIQRVQMEAARTILAGDGAMCCFFGGDSKWYSVETDAFRLVFDDFTSAAPGWNLRLNAFLNESHHAPVFHFSPGDTLVCLGATWNLTGFFENLRQLRYEGINCVFYMHDLLPLTHPEYFEENHVIEFGYWFINVLEVASGLICNSDETRDSVLALSGFDGPVDIVDLGVRPEGSQGLCSGVERPALAAPSTVLTRHGLMPEDYVLMVGTLEPRKNHVTAFNVWVALDKALKDKCPKLVIVGKIGWKSEGIIAHFQALNRHSRIIRIADATDIDLAVLYKNCLCSLYISRSEGWGLPVSEGLAAGRPVVCGKGSCAVRAGQGLVIPVDECSERDIFTVLQSLFVNRDQLEEMAQTIKEQCSFKTWKDFGREVVASMEKMALTGTSRQLTPVGLGKTYAFGRRSRFHNLDRGCFADGLLWGDCWHNPEDWGIWSKNAKAELRFRLPDYECYDVYIRVVSSQPSANFTLFKDGDALVKKRVYAPTLLKTTIAMDPDKTFVSLFLETDKFFDLATGSDTPDLRLLGVGLADIRFVRSNDMLGRLEALESFL
jgi:glycosyltransferase involved in cell wall biosynthesis